MNVSSTSCSIYHLNARMCVPLDLFLSKQTNELQCQEEAGSLDASSAGAPLSSLALVPCLLLYFFYICYKQPRERVKHLPTAPTSSSAFLKQPIASFLNFIGGHLTEMGRNGLEEFSSKWFGDAKTPIVTYYHGRSPVVLVADPDAARIVLRSSNDRSSTDVFYDSPLALSTAQGADWKRLRKAIMPKMYKIAKESRPVVFEKGHKLCQVLGDKPSNRSIDFLQLLRSFSLDVFGKVLFDVDLNTLGGDNVDLLEDANEVSMFQVMANRNFLIQWSASLFRFQAEPFVNFVSLFTSKNTIAKVCHGQNIKSPENNRDQESPSTWLDWWTSEFGAVLSRTTAYTFAFAALDNTAVAMATFLYHMAKNPQVQARLRQEIIAHCYGSKENSGLQDTSFAAKAITCQYLDWCIKESMRLFSHVSFFGRYMVEDTTIPGKDMDYIIPKGTPCMIATDLLHKSKAQWKDPDQFRPERFDHTSQEHKQRHQFAYLPLAYGRSCAGQALVQEQMKTTMAMLLHSFEFGIDGSKMKEHGNHLHYETGLAKFPVNGVHLTIHPCL